MSDLRNVLQEEQLQVFIGQVLRSSWVVSADAIIIISVIKCEYYMIFTMNFG